MKLNTWIPVGLAVVLGLAAAFVAKSVVSKRKGAGETTQVKVVVIKENLSPGSPIKPTDLSVSPFAVEQKPDGSFNDPNLLVGRVALSPLVRGQVVVETLLAPVGAQAGIQNLIPAGMRLITVEVNEFSSLSGMLAPGCRVDILAALSDPETHEMMARTIVEDIQVRAVGQRVTPGGAEPTKPEDQQAGFRSVTLLVTPKEAESIHVAGTAGRPWLILRGTGDDHIEKSPGVGMVELRTGSLNPGIGALKATQFTIAHSDKPATTQSIARMRTVTFIKGGKIETIQVDEASAPPIEGTLTHTDLNEVTDSGPKTKSNEPIADTTSEQAPIVKDESLSGSEE